MCFIIRILNRPSINHLQNWNCKRIFFSLWPTVALTNLPLSKRNRFPWSKQGGPSSRGPRTGLGKLQLIWSPSSTRSMWRRTRFKPLWWWTQGNSHIRSKKLPTNLPSSKESRSNPSSEEEQSERTTRNYKKKISILLFALLADWRIFSTKRKIC